MFCGNCGNELREGARFCPKCGAITRLGRQQNQPSAEPEQAMPPVIPGPEPVLEPEPAQEPAGTNTPAEPAIEEDTAPAPRQQVRQRPAAGKAKPAVRLKAMPVKPAQEAQPAQQEKPARPVSPPSAPVVEKPAQQPAAPAQSSFLETGAARFASAVGSVKDALGGGSVQCGSCGTKLKAGTKFCPECGTPVAQAERQNTHDTQDKQDTKGHERTDDPTHSLTIQMAEPIAVTNPEVSVQINPGGISAKIKGGETISFDLPQGKYTVSFKCSFQKAAIEVHLCRDSVIAVAWNMVTGGIEARQIGEDSNAQSREAAPVKSKGKRTAVLLAAGAILVSIIIGGLWGIVSDGTAGGNTPHSVETKNSANLSEAYINCAKQITLESLSSPSTARFTNCEVEEIDDYGRTLVSMTIDSQNGFGAMIRNYAIVILQRYDVETNKYSYNPTFAVQIYSNVGNKDLTIKMTKQLNNWNEERSSE